MGASEGIANGHWGGMACARRRRWAALGLLAREIGAAGGVALVFSLREEQRGLYGENHCWRAAEIKHSSWRLSREDGAEWRMTLNAHGIPQHIDGADGDDAWQLRDYLHRSTRR